MHLWLNWIFSAAIALHIIETSLGLPGVALVALAYVGWRYRLTGGRRLARIDWPFERPVDGRRRSTMRQVARWALIPILLVAATAGPVASGLIVSALAS